MAIDLKKLKSGSSINLAVLKGEKKQPAKSLHPRRLEASAERFKQAQVNAKKRLTVAQKIEERFKPQRGAGPAVWEKPPGTLEKIKRSLGYIGQDFSKTALSALSLPEQIVRGEIPPAELAIGAMQPFAQTVANIADPFGRGQQALRERPTGTILDALMTRGVLNALSPKAGQFGVIETPPAKGPRIVGIRPGKRVAPRAEGFGEGVIPQKPGPGGPSGKPILAKPPVEAVGAQIIEGKTYTLKGFGNVVAEKVTPKQVTARTANGAVVKMPVTTWYDSLVIRRQIPTKPVPTTVAPEQLPGKTPRTEYPESQAEVVTPDPTQAYAPGRNVLWAPIEDVLQRRLNLSNAADREIIRQYLEGGQEPPPPPGMPGTEGVRPVKPKPAPPAPISTEAPSVTVKPPVAEGKGIREWTVTTSENIIIGGRKLAEPVERRFTVQAKTAAAARKSVLEAGHKNIVGVEASLPTPKSTPASPTAKPVPAPPVEAISAIPKTVQRVEEPGAGPSTVDKPHGVYTTPVEYPSPHADLGGERYTWDTNPNANVLSVDVTDLYRTNRGEVGQSAGIGALRQLIGEDATANLFKMTKSELAQKLSAEYPNVQWDRYYDQAEMAEGYAGMKGRKAGYDAFYGYDRNFPQMSEYVGLTENAMSPGKPTPKPSSPPAAVRPPSPLPEAAPPTPKPSSAGEAQAGKARIDLMLGLTGKAIGGIALYGAFEGWRKDAEKERSRPYKGRRIFTNYNPLSVISDTVQLGDYAISATTKGIAVGSPSKIPQYFAEGATMSETGPLGLVADITLDPLNFIAYNKLAKYPIKALKTAAKTTTLDQKMGLAVAALNETRTVKRMLDVLEFDRWGTTGRLGILKGGIGTVRGTTLEARAVLEKETDKTVKLIGERMDKVRPVADHILKGGREFAVDVGVVVDEGWQLSARGVNSGLFAGAADETVRKAKGKTLQLIFRKRYADLMANGADKVEAATQARAYIGDVSQTAKKFMDLENESGDLLEAAGLITKETAQTWKDVHAKVMYRRYEDVEEFLHHLKKKDPARAAELKAEWLRYRAQDEKLRERGSPFKIYMRQDLPLEIRELLEQETNSATRLLLGQHEAASMAGRAMMYKRLAGSVAIDEGKYQAMLGALKQAGKAKSPEAAKLAKEIDQWRQIPTADDPFGKYFGALAGKYVPEAYFYDLMNSVPQGRSVIGEVVRRNVSRWKAGKVVWSLPTSARNMMTNVVLADVLGKTSPFRLDIYYKALRSLAKKDETYQEAKAAGVFLHDTFFHSEIDDVLEYAHSDPFTKWNTVKRATDKVLRKPGEAYEFNERWFKMAVYQHSRETGMTPDMAAEFADRALFNYRKIPKGLDTLRKHGFLPFVAFPYKAIPAMSQAFWSDTGRLAKYAKIPTAIEKQIPYEQRRREEAVLPPWMEGMTKLPGAGARYLNTEYMNPYGGIADVGRPGDIIGQINPFATMAGDILYNRNSYLDREIANTRSPLGEQIMKRGVEYPLNFLMPSMTPPIPGILPRGGTAVSGGILGKSRTGVPRSLLERAAYLAGLKTTTLDVGKAKMAVIRDYKAQKAADLSAGYKQIMQIVKDKNVASPEDLPPREKAQVEKIRANFRKRRAKADREFARQAKQANE